MGPFMCNKFCSAQDCPHQTSIISIQRFGLIEKKTYRTSGQVSGGNGVGHGGGRCWCVISTIAVKTESLLDKSVESAFDKFI